MAHIGIIKFQLAGIQFGMYADRILEIIRLTEYRKIPQPLPYVVGLIELRNYIVTIVDFRRRLGLPSMSELSRSSVIVVNIASQMYGLIVETISDFRQIPEDHVLPPISVAGFPEQLLLGVIADKDDIMMIPDLDKIFSSFIKVQLLPITPAEKIAFQYRFTPGSLIRTLENTLIKEHALNYRIVNKLPRSMCMPSSIVYKVITYYNDFWPHTKEETGGQETGQTTFSQKTHAGDETYLSLSQKMLEEQEELGEQEKSQRISKQKHEKHPVFEPISKLSPGKNLELLLRRLTEKNGSGKPGTFPTIVTSQASLAKQFARSLRMSPLALAKYVSYYAMLPVQTQRDRETKSKTPVDERIQELCADSQSMEDVLQTLGQERYTLNLRLMRQLAQQFQIPTVMLSRIFFTIPGLSYEPETEQEEPEMEQEQEEHDVPLKHVAARHADIGARLARNRSAAENLQILAKSHDLTDNRTLRSVASHLRMPTCRVSKLRSYYHLV